MNKAERAEARRIWEKLKRWKEHPAAFAREELGFEPDPWQEDVLEAFPHNNRLIMKACKGPGKTAVEAILALNFLATRPHCRIGGISITDANLKSAMWPELALWLNKSAFLRNTFQWTKTAIVHRSHPGTWWMQARSWPKRADAQQQADALAGLHADYAMWVCDEVGGYPQAVMTTCEAVLASGIETKVLAGGNPTHTTGPLYRACTVDRSLWYVKTITGDPNDPKAWVHSPRVKFRRSAAGLTPLEHNAQQIKSYGRENPWVKVNVLGEFPPASINALLGVDEVEAAMARKLRSDSFTHMQKRLGVDVARFGDDRTVIFPRQGLASFRPVVMRNARTTDIAARVMMAEHDWAPDGDILTLVDDTGHWGHGVIDNLRTAGRAAIGINYAAKALDPRFKNRRAEFYVKGAAAVKNGACLPNLPEMIAELTEQTYTFVNGQFMLEEKQQFKDRLGYSPDLTDAYMQTYAFPELPSRAHAILSRGHSGTVGKALTERAEGQDPEIVAETLRILREFDPSLVY